MCRQGTHLVEDIQSHFRWLLGLVVNVGVSGQGGVVGVSGQGGVVGISGQGGVVGVSGQGGVFAVSGQLVLLSWLVIIFDSTPQLCTCEYVHTGYR